MIGFHVRDTNVNKKIYPNRINGIYNGNYNGIPYKKQIGQQWFLMTQVFIIIIIFFDLLLN